MSTQKKLLDLLALFLILLSTNSLNFSSTLTSNDFIQAQVQHKKNRCCEFRNSGKTQNAVKCCLSNFTPECCSGLDLSLQESENKSSAGSVIQSVKDYILDVDLNVDLGGAGSRNTGTARRFEDVSFGNEDDQEFENKSHSFDDRPRRSRSMRSNTSGFLVGTPKFVDSDSQSESDAEQSEEFLDEDQGFQDENLENEFKNSSFENFGFEDEDDGEEFESGESRSFLDDSDNEVGFPIDEQETEEQVIFSDDQNELKENNIFNQDNAQFEEIGDENGPEDGSIDYEENDFDDQDFIDEAGEEQSPGSTIQENFAERDNLNFNSGQANKSKNIKNRNKKIKNSIDDFDETENSNSASASTIEIRRRNGQNISKMSRQKTKNMENEPNTQFQDNFIDERDGRDGRRGRDEDEIFEAESGESGEDAFTEGDGGDGGDGGDSFTQDSDAGDGGDGGRGGDSFGGRFSGGKSTASKSGGKRRNSRANGSSVSRRSNRRKGNFGKGGKGGMGGEVFELEGFKKSALEPKGILFSPI